jgi:hypothetical protein
LGFTSSAPLSAPESLEPLERIHISHVLWAPTRPLVGDERGEADHRGADASEIRFDASWPRLAERDSGDSCEDVYSARSYAHLETCPGHGEIRLGQVAKGRTENA